MNINEIIYMRYNAWHMIITNHNYYIIKIQMSARASQSLGDLGKLCSNLCFHDALESKLLSQILSSSLHLYI
jgi:hypothetical protein